MENVNLLTVRHRTATITSIHEMSMTTVTTMMTTRTSAMTTALFLCLSIELRVLAKDLMMTLLMRTR
jgi:hypothetical protein